jgi:hypothetical protein
MTSQPELTDDIKNWGSRALWTALESGLAVLLAANLLSFDVTTVQAAGVAALSSGLTVISAFVRHQREEAEDKTESGV